MPKNEQNFKHKYVFIFLHGEELPSIKFYSDSAYNAAGQFILDYVNMERKEDFDVKQGKTKEELTLEIYPNEKLVNMLELDAKRKYIVMVVREDKLKKIDKNFYKLFDY